MASHSKLFTAIAIMQLREEGKLRLDDPVEKYLSWFKAAPAGDDDGQITIEQLLSHSSGLQREAGDHWVSYEFPTADQLQRLYAERKAAFAPSVRWKYSNLAYAVAGMVIEQVTAQPWANYVDRNIFQPLAMTSSSVDKNVSGLAIPYGRRMPDGTREVLPFVDARGMAAPPVSRQPERQPVVSANFHRARAAPWVVTSGSWREMHRCDRWRRLRPARARIRHQPDPIAWTGHGGGYPGTTQTFLRLDDKVGVVI
jgi:CubicO group peptidase (beta-lactamase class C family)